MVLRQIDSQLFLVFIGRYCEGYLFSLKYRRNQRRSVRSIGSRFLTARVSWFLSVFGRFGDFFFCNNGGFIWFTRRGFMQALGRIELVQFCFSRQERLVSVVGLRFQFFERDRVRVVWKAVFSSMLQFWKIEVEWVRGT